MSTPLAWQVFTYALLSILATTLTFLFIARYARVETVTGQIVPDLGLANIVPSRAGVVTDIKVSEGTYITATSPLVTVQVEETVRSGYTGPAQVLKALSEQDDQLAVQQRSTSAGAVSTRKRIDAQIIGLQAETVAIDQQIASQQRLVEVARNDYDRSETIAAKGFLSRRDLQLREENLLSRQQQIANLSQARAQKQAMLVEARESIEEVGHAAQSSAASLAGERASITQRRFDVEASRGYTLIAPIDGLVTAVTARVGQPAQPGKPLMTIVPSGARLEARLDVPTQAIGFLSVGQEVRLQINAFPYAQFGSVPAVIRRISAGAINRETADGRSEPMYPVVAVIDDPRIYAFGKFHRLQPDMTLTARIITERRSLAEWLFEPILAVRRR